MRKTGLPKPPSLESFNAGGVFARFGLTAGQHFEMRAMTLVYDAMCSELFSPGMQRLAVRAEAVRLTLEEIGLRYNLYKKYETFHGPAEDGNLLDDALKLAVICGRLTIAIAEENHPGFDQRVKYLAAAIHNEAAEIRSGYQSANEFDDRSLFLAHIQILETFAGILTEIGNYDADRIRKIQEEDLARIDSYLVFDSEIGQRVSEERTIVEEALTARLEYLEAAPEPETTPTVFESNVVRAAFPDHFRPRP